MAGARMADAIQSLRMNILINQNRTGIRWSVKKVWPHKHKINFIPPPPIFRHPGHGNSIDDAVRRIVNEWNAWAFVNSDEPLADWEVQKRRRYTPTDNGKQFSFFAFYLCGLCGSSVGLLLLFLFALWTFTFVDCVVADVGQRRKLGL